MDIRYSDVCCCLLDFSLLKNRGEHGADQRGAAATADHQPPSVQEAPRLVRLGALDGRLHERVGRVRGARTEAALSRECVSVCVAATPTLTPRPSVCVS